MLLGNLGAGILKTLRCIATPIPDLDPVKLHLQPERYLGLVKKEWVCHSDQIQRPKRVHNGYSIPRKRMATRHFWDTNSAQSMLPQQHRISYLMMTNYTNSFSTLRWIRRSADSRNYLRLPKNFSEQIILCWKFQIHLMGLFATVEYPKIQTPLIQDQVVFTFTLPPYSAGLCHYGEFWTFCRSLRLVTKGIWGNLVSFGHHCLLPIIRLMEQVWMTRKLPLLSSTPTFWSFWKSLFIATMRIMIQRSY